MADEKSSPRRDYRFSRSSRNQRSVASNILDAIAQFGGGDAAEEGRPSTRMKILVRKDDLKQVLAAIRTSDGRVGSVRRVSASPQAALSLEQRLNWMRRRQILRGACLARGRSQGGSWRPVLQSIPEEI